MTKTITNSSLVIALAIASLFVILVFVTAKTYSQLAVAVVLYPALIFLSFMVFPRESWRLPRSTIRTWPKSNLAQVETLNPDEELVGAADGNRRVFMKLILATGISFLLFSIFGKRVGSLFLGGSAQQGINPAESRSTSRQDEAPQAERYKISEIDEGTSVTYYGFIDKDGVWFVMKEDIDKNSFRYAGGNSGFPDNWKNRENLKYDYFNNLF